MFVVRFDAGLCRCCHLTTHCHPSGRGKDAAIFIARACAPGDLLFSDSKQQIPRAAKLSMGTATYSRRREE